MRVHGTIQARPVGVFRLEEPRLRPAPTEAYNVPIYTTAKVHRDHRIEVAKALYSVPGNLIGTRVEVRADRSLVRVFAGGQLVKVHPRQAPGRRVTVPHDLPEERSAYARPRPPPPAGRSTRPGDRHLRHRPAGHAVAPHRDAPGLCPARPGKTLGRRGRSGSRAFADPGGLRPAPGQHRLQAQLALRARRLLQHSQRPQHLHHGGRTVTPIDELRQVLGRQ